MKKKLLATGVAIALGAFSGAACADLSVDASGIGTINIVPYFSAQNGNNTLLNIVNTDTTNGKAVKVRFRGAEWSDDIFDFQVFLSPGDMWTAAVAQEDGVAFLVTKDTSCTRPMSIAKSALLPDSNPARKNKFGTARLVNAATGTLEGYIEIITMANIPQGIANATWVESASTGPRTTASVNTLYSAIKHVSNGMPGCQTSATAANLIDGLKSDNAFNTPLGAAGVPVATSDEQSWMTDPTASLMSYATIINVPASKAFTNNAVAIKAATPVKQYFRQMATFVPFNPNLTADRIFAASTSSTGTASVPAPATKDSHWLDLGANVGLSEFDLPDLTTPHDAKYLQTSGSTTPAPLNTQYSDGNPTSKGYDYTFSQAALAQRDDFAVLLQKSAVVTDYVTDASLQAATDIVMSQPLRRYFYEYRQLADSATDQHITLKGKKYYINGSAWSPMGLGNTLTGTTVLSAGNVAASTATPTIGLNYIDLDGATNRIAVGNYSFYDREENTQTASSDNSQTSPQPEKPTLKVSLMGEVSVISINAARASQSPTQTGALGAMLTINDYTDTSGKFVDGWITLSTTTTGTNVQKLPVIGFTAINVFNASVGAAGTHYGLTVPLRWKP